MSDEQTLSLGFVGLGQMGSGMAANLLKAGFAVTVFNRTSSKADPLVAQGAQRAQSLRQACQNDGVVTMLADDASVEHAVFSEEGVLANLRRGGLHVSSSTISVALSRRLTEAHAAKGQLFVAAPVFGRPDVAAAGKLSVITGGGAEALEAAAPILSAIGEKRFHISERPQDANLVKLSGNFLIASVIETLGEALALVAKAGIDRARYIDILTSTLFSAPVYRTYGDALAQERFSPAGFAAPLGRKDIRLVEAAADDLQVPMPVVGLLRDRFLTLLAQGGEDLDWSAIGGLAAVDAGLTAKGLGSKSGGEG